MSSKHKKVLGLSKRETPSDYLKIIKKKSVNLSEIVDKNKYKILSDKKSLITSLKNNKTSYKSKNIPIICTKPHNIVNFTPTKDNYGWFKITIRYGQKYGRNFIILNLLKCIYPHVFTPVMYREEGNRSVFFIDDEESAFRLGSCNKKIITKDGYKLGVKIEKGFPEGGIEKYDRRSQIKDRTLASKLKYVAAKRICEETKTLDLTRFHCDPDLVDDYFCGLFISNIFSTIVDFVVEYIPELEVLKLQKNNLRLSSNLAKDISKFSNLKTLYLSDNLIRNLNGLTLLKNLKLEKFYLQGNPLRGQELDCSKNYVKYIETLFPTLSVLDGIKIEKPIVIELEDEEEEKEEEEDLPSPIKNFSCNFEVHEIAQQFIKKYFSAYDSDSREPLLSLYHKSAFFSMTLTSITSKSQESRNLDDYNSFHRNLIIMKSADQRRSLLNQGRLSIITLLSLLPNTYHYLNSFSTDVAMQTNNRLMISISGCFKEINTQLQLFYFNRTFIISVESGNHTIFNDQLYLSHPTSQQKLQAAHEFLTLVPEKVDAASEVSESKPTFQSESMEKHTFDVNSTSDIQVNDEPVKEEAPDLILIPNSKIQDKPIKEKAPDLILVSNSEIRAEPMEESVDINSTSDPQIPIESIIIKSEPSSPSAELTEPEIAADKLLKEKLINLQEVLSNCLSTIEKFLSDEEFNGSLN